MKAAAVLSTEDYAELSARFDALSELGPAERAEALQALREVGHPMLPRLERMLAALDGPRTDALLPLPVPPPTVDGRDGTLAAGTRLGPWSLVAPLGRGGMGEVWRAERADGAYRRSVALKLPRPAPGQDGRTRAERFARERDILASLDHPNIARLLDAGIESDGRAWIAIELVEGEGLLAHCDRLRAGLKHRVDLFCQVLRAVQHAHERLVIHRDIKPGNVLVDTQGSVRLLDFGIAKLLDGDASVLADDTELTRLGGRPLTPRYASPEQLAGAPLGTASDVYSLGVLLHELLTGRCPYPAAATARELERAIEAGEPPRPSRGAPDPAGAARRGLTPSGLRRALDPELDAVLLRALARRPEERYRSVIALHDDLERWRRRVPVQARVPSPAYRAWRFAARHPVAVGASSVAILALLAVSVVAAAMGLRAQQEADRAVLTRDFLLDVFGKADSDSSRGAEISAREMLDWGRRRAAAMQAEPTLRAELLLEIGNAQIRATDYPGAAVTLGEAAALFERSGPPVLQARTLSLLAEVDWRQGRLEAAARWLGLAREAAGRAPPDPLRAQLDWIGGGLALARGDIELAQRLDGEAVQAALRAWPPGRDERALIQLQQARSSNAAGDHDRALAQLDSLVEELRHSRNGNPTMQANVEFVRSQILARLGRYGASATGLESALAECERQVGSAHEACAKLRRMLALAWLRQGETERCVGLLPAIRSEVATTGSRARRDEALSMWGRILGGQEVPDAARSPWRELQATASVEGPDAPPASARVLAMQTLAEAWLRSDRPDEAVAWVARSEAAIAATGTAAASLAVFAVRATALRAAADTLRGDAGAARSGWARAEQAASRAFGADHPMTALYAVNAAWAHAAAGDAAAARSSAQRWLPVLRQALGDAAPSVARVSAWLDPPAAARPANGRGFLL